MKILQYKQLVIRGGNIVIPGKKIISNPNIYISDGCIKQIRPIKIKDIPTINLHPRQYISPGFIDLHCHLREPGDTRSETIKTGTLSALAGGFTKVCCMPNTNPAIDCPKLVRYILEKSRRVNQAEVLVIGCATKERAGKEIVDIKSMVKTGIVAVSDDGSPISDAKIMYRLLLACKDFGIPVINHCEIINPLMNQQTLYPKSGFDASESLMVLRDIILADYAKAHIHIAHVSTKKSVELIRWAKKTGVKITAETCPHYFTLTKKDCNGVNTNYKVSPPLRAEDDVEAIKHGLADGTIDVIASDHAPWHISKKQVRWQKAKSGMIGFETAFSLGYQELVLKKYLSLENYIACLTTKPAKILGLNISDKISEGTSVSITIFDLSKEWIFSQGNILSKSKNSPFIGKKLKGKIDMVILKDRMFDFTN
ncbi:MAG: dihydroorotase [candidate division WOR-3 bacterium]